jgi:tetratricopeptide (TPR) repeat protein
MRRTAGVRDRYGLPISTGSQTAAEQYVEGIDRLLSQNAGAEAGLRAAVEADTGFALGWADLAFVLAYQRQAEAAKRAVAHAEELIGGASRRERRHVAAVSAFVNGQTDRPAALVREHLAESPRDALLVQMAVMLLSGSGRITRREESRAMLEGLAPAYGEDWWFLGSLAFAHHETESYEQSRRFSERSLALYPRNGNAAHSRAHVFFETTDHTAGARFLGPWLEEYDRAAPFMCHLSWHLALFELAAGHEQRVMELYERSISPAVAQQRTTLEDAASLLWRYEIYGCPPRELPWAEIRDHAARMTAQPGMAFLDAHAALAYAGMGDEPAMDRHVDGLRALAARGSPLVEEVVLPLVLGIRAFGQRNYEETIRLLQPLGEQLVRIGGSHAQREVFEDTLLQAYLRSGRCEQATALLQERLSRRASDRDVVWLEQARCEESEVRRGTR